MARVVFAEAVPAGVELEQGPFVFATGPLTAERATACGWPYRVDDTADGSLVARYRFLEYDVVVSVRGPRDAALAVLASARPDWQAGTEGVVALVELWRGGGA